MSWFKRSPLPPILPSGPRVYTSVLRACRCGVLCDAASKRCARCAGTVCPAPRCGLAKRAEASTCGDSSCKRWWTVKQQQQQTDVLPMPVRKRDTK